MTWFFIALLVAIGGIWTAYVRSKEMKVSDAAARAKAQGQASASKDSANADKRDV